MEIIKTTRGGSKLLLDGYQYVKKKYTEKWIRWVCCDSRRTGCKGALTTDNTAENPRMFILHNHSPDQTKSLVLKFRSELKAKALEKNARPSEVLSEVLAGAPLEVCERVGSLEHCKRGIRRLRQKQNTQEKVLLDEMHCNGNSILYSPENDHGGFLIYNNSLNAKALECITRPSEFPSEVLLKASTNVCERDVLHKQGFEGLTKEQMAPEVVILDELLNIDSTETDNPEMVHEEFLIYDSVLRAKTVKMKTRPNNDLSKVTAGVSLDVCERAGSYKQGIGKLRQEQTLLLDELQQENNSIQDNSETDLKDFLIYDSGKGKSDRIVVFASSEQLKSFAASSEWFMEENFIGAPEPFKNVFVISVPFPEKSLVCVCAFLPGLCQSTIVEMINALIKKCKQLNLYLDPLCILMDVQSTTTETILSVFGHHVDMKKCDFNFGRTWRKIQSLGLLELYNTYVDVQQFCGMLEGLAFLPVECVDEAMSYLHEIVPDGLEDLIEYFDRSYVSGTFCKVQKRLENGEVVLAIDHRPPVYPPQFWTLFKSALEWGNETNVQLLLEHRDPSLWTPTDITMLLSSKKRSSQACGNVTEFSQKTIYTVCVGFQSGSCDLVSTLQAVGQCIRFSNT